MVPAPNNLTFSVLETLTSISICSFDTTTTTKTKNMQKSSSFIRNLPVANAEPEQSRRESVVCTAHDVETITASGRVHNVDDDDEEDLSLLKKSSARASLISVSICKPSADMVMGLGFRSVAGELQIIRVSPNGALAQSPLQPGDRLISLDTNSNTSHWTAHQAANYVRNKVGLLSIVVRTKEGDPNRVAATIYKSSRDEKIGLGFKQEDGCLRIGHLNPRGLLGDMSVLKLGDYIETINGMNIAAMDPSLALEIVRGAVGKLDIRAKHTNTAELSVRDVDMDLSHIRESRRLSSEHFLTTADEVGDSLTSSNASNPHEGPRDDTGMVLKPGFISVKVTKATKAMRLGISFSNPTESRLQISSILDDSLLYSSPLRPGCVVHSLNNVRCRHWTKRDALQFVKNALGDVLFMAQDPHGDPAYATALAYKTSARASIGLSFKSTGGPLRVGNVKADGIFGDSILNADDDVLSINGIPCQHMSPVNAVEIIRQSTEIVCLLVKPYRKNGMVLSHASRTPGGDEYERAIKTSRTRR